MQMDYILGTCLLMQIIYILGDYRHIEVFFQFLDEFMPLVRLRSIEFMAQHIIEVCY
ncbi:Uncharacterised protein [Segatella copri]|nr:Uncharacterised protein [Segatella copri]